MLARFARERGGLDAGGSSCASSFWQQLSSRPAFLLLLE
jgi:hypothetical protein